MTDSRRIALEAKINGTASTLTPAEIQEAIRYFNADITAINAAKDAEIKNVTKNIQVFGKDADTEPAKSFINKLKQYQQNIEKLETLTLLHDPTTVPLDTASIKTNLAMEQKKLEATKEKLKALQEESSKLNEEADSVIDKINETAAKQAKINELKEKYEAALEIPKIAFATRGEEAHKEVSAIASLIRDMNTKLDELTSKAKAYGLLELPVSSPPLLPYRLTADKSSPEEVRVADAEITDLITKLQAATTAAANAYDTSLAKLAKDSPEAADSLRKQHWRESAPLLLDTKTLMTNKDIETIKEMMELKTALDTAGTALLNYLNTNNSLTLSDTAQRHEFAEKAPGEIERLQKNLREAIEKVNEAVAKDLADRKAAENLAKRKVKTKELSDKIDSASAAAVLKFNTDYPNAAAYSATDVSLQTSIKTCTDIDDALKKFHEEMLDPAGNLRDPPLTVAQLSMLEAKITAAIDKLNAAVDDVKLTYDNAKITADAAKAAAASTAGHKLKSDQDTLTASIASVIDPNSDAGKLLASIAGTKEKTLEPHEKAINALINDLKNLQGDIPSTTQNRLDNPPIDLKKNIAAKIAALDQAVKTARTDVDLIRAQHVHAKFNRYKERVGLIEGLVDVVAQPDKADKYTNTIAEIERIREDLVAYQKWVRNKDATATDEAQKLIVKLNNITNELKAAALPADYGIRYFGKQSEKVEGTDETTFQAAIDKVKDKFKATYGGAATTGGGVGTLRSGGSTKTDRFTAGFKGLEGLTGKDFVGRVTLNKTESKNTILKKDPIVSISTQRIKDGARVSEIEFIKFDESKSVHLHAGSNASRLPNDRVLKHAIKDVLNHILADKSPELRAKLSDDMTKELLKGIIPPALKQMATSPIYINGNLHDNYAEAVMLFCDYINLDCHDTRKGKDVHIIKKVDHDHSVSYIKSITKNPERYFGEAKPVVTPTPTIKALDVDTTPKLK